MTIFDNIWQYLAISDNIKPNIAKPHILNKIHQYMTSYGFLKSFWSLQDRVRERFLLFAEELLLLKSSLKLKVNCCTNNQLLCTPSPPPYRNSMSVISQLLLTRFWWNFKGRFLGTSRTDHNCQGDICPRNICPRDIWPYQEYLSCYLPDFYETLKVGSWEHLQVFQLSQWHLSRWHFFISRIS